MKNLGKTVITIMSLVSIASVMNYAGMIFVIAEALANATGAYYPLFVPLIGALVRSLRVAIPRRTSSSESSKPMWLPS